MSEFNGCNSAQYNYAYMDVTAGEKQMLDIFAQFGGKDADAVVASITADSVEAKSSIESAEVRGYFRAVRAMIDSGMRRAWEDNGNCGHEPSCTAHDFAVRLAQHGGYPAEWLEEIAALEGADGKMAQNAAEARGYNQALNAIVAAGFKTAWIDDRKQMFL